MCNKRNFRTLGYYTYSICLHLIWWRQLIQFMYSNWSVARSVFEIRYIYIPCQPGALWWVNNRRFKYNIHVWDKELHVIHFLMEFSFNFWIRWLRVDTSLFISFLVNITFGLRDLSSFYSDWNCHSRKYLVVTADILLVAN